LGANKSTGDGPELFCSALVLAGCSEKKKKTENKTYTIVIRGANTIGEELPAPDR